MTKVASSLRCREPRIKDLPWLREFTSQLNSNDENLRKAFLRGSVRKGRKLNFRPNFAMFSSNATSTNFKSRKTITVHCISKASRCMEGRPRGGSQFHMELIDFTGCSSAIWGLMQEMQLCTLLRFE